VKNIDRKTILKISKLANIEITEDEVEIYSKQIEEILQYVNKLNRVKKEETSFQSHTNLKNIFRDDISKTSLSSSEALQNRSKKIKDNLFIITEVLNR